MIDFSICLTNSFNHVRYDNRLHQTLASENNTVQFMSPKVCMCSNMFRIDPQHLGWILESLVKGMSLKKYRYRKTLPTMCALHCNAGWISKTPLPIG